MEARTSNSGGPKSWEVIDEELPFCFFLFSIFFGIKIKITSYVKVYNQQNLPSNEIILKAISWKKKVLQNEAKRKEKWGIIVLQVYNVNL